MGEKGWEQAWGRGRAVPALALKEEGGCQQGHPTQFYLCPFGGKLHGVLGRPQVHEPCVGGGTDEGEELFKDYSPSAPLPNPL